MNNKIQSNIWKIHLHNALSSLFFAVPIMVLFWQDNWLSLTQIMILQSVFAISVVILEIPTGYFSDRYGRKKALIIAWIMSLFGMISYSLGYNFYHFLIAEMFFAFSISFESGTISTFVYDTLLELKQEKRYKIVWWNILFTGMLSLAYLV